MARNSRRRRSIPKGTLFQITQEGIFSHTVGNGPRQEYKKRSLLSFTGVPVTPSQDVFEVTANRNSSQSNSQGYDGGYVLAKSTDPEGDEPILVRIASKNFSQIATPLKTKECSPSDNSPKATVDYHL